MATDSQNPLSLKCGDFSRDTRLLEQIENTLYTAVIADALDQLGYRDQAMREYLRPVYACAPFAGWARTMFWMDVYHAPPEPYGIELEAMDSILPDEVVIVSTGQSKRNAPWGELMSTAAVARGARGAVVDGLVRDVRKIEALGFPLFAAGMKPVDSQGRGLVMGYNQPVECGEVLVNPGDLIFADRDGVVVVPAVALADAVRLAAEKVTRENHSREELKRGVFLQDVYKKYGVL